MRPIYLNKTALVTGGSSGIGLATARLLAQAGANVWILARRKEQLEAALAEVSACRVDSAQRFGILPADVADPDQVNAALQNLTQETGTPDILINSAGITEPGYLVDQDVQVLRQQMEINWMGSVYTVKAVLPGMIQRKSGYIVNICSMAGVIGLPVYAGYTSSKFAVRGFSDSLRAELPPLGINVSIVYPPDTETPQLVYDRSVRPAVMNTLLSLDEPVPADLVARELLKGMQRRQYVIIPGTNNRFFFWLQWVLGNKRYKVLDLFIRWAVRKTNSMKAAHP